MKKVFTIAIVAMFGFGMVACKKDYNCTCTANGDTDVLPLGKQKKSDAEAACDAFNVTYSVLGGSCSL